MVKICALTMPFVLALAACGDDGGGEGGGPDADVPDPADAMPQNVCTLIEASYPDLGMVTGTALVKPIDSDMPDGPKEYELQIPLNQESPPDVLFLEIYEDSPPFDSGPAPYSTTLIADNSDLFMCGACTYIAADFSDPKMIDFNMAYSGQLEISVLDPTPGTGKVTGTLSNVKLHDVFLNSVPEQETVLDGCNSTIAGVQFDFDVAAAP
jgi:hypothetical protein